MKGIKMSLFVLALIIVAGWLMAYSTPEFYLPRKVSFYIWAIVYTLVIAFVLRPFSQGVPIDEIHNFYIVAASACIWVALEHICLQFKEQHFWYSRIFLCLVLPVVQGYAFRGNMVLLCENFHMTWYFVAIIILLSAYFEVFFFEFPGSWFHRVIFLLDKLCFYFLAFHLSVFFALVVHWAMNLRYLCALCDETHMFHGLMMLEAGQMNKLSHLIICFCLPLILAQAAIHLRLCSLEIAGFTFAILYLTLRMTLDSIMFAILSGIIKVEILFCVSSK